MPAAAAGLEVCIDLDPRHLSMVDYPLLAGAGLGGEIIFSVERQFQALVRHRHAREGRLGIVGQRDGFMLPDKGLTYARLETGLIVQQISEDAIQRFGNPFQLVPGTFRLRRVEQQAGAGTRESDVPGIDHVDGLVDALLHQVCRETGIFQVVDSLERNQSQLGERTGSLAPERRKDLGNEGFVDEGNNHSIETQALGLVDGHHAHGVLAVRCADSLLVAGFIPPFDKSAQGRTVFLLPSQDGVEKSVDERQVGFRRRNGGIFQQSLTSLVERATLRSHRLNPEL